MIPRLIYSALYLIALLFLLPFEYRKRPKEFRHRWLREKFGYFEKEEKTPPPQSPPCQGGSPQATRRGEEKGVVWIHAVSVGEVMAAIPLLKRLK
ncbi:MAG: glycosyltransferase N-terminal domain-containing protein, partial [Nitrospirota bacterium]